MADIYGAKEGFEIYHATRNHDIPAATDEEITASLLVASEWIDARYRKRFPGTKLGDRSQLRDWPRLDAWDIYGNSLIGVPLEIEHAVYELAAIQTATPGALTKDFTPGKYQSVAVSGAVSVVYASINSVEQAQTQFGIVEEILSTILADNSSSSFVGTSHR